MEGRETQFTDTWMLGPLGSRTVCGTWLSAVLAGRESTSVVSWAFGVPRAQPNLLIPEGNRGHVLMCEKKRVFR